MEFLYLGTEFTRGILTRDLRNLEAKLAHVQILTYLKSEVTAIQGYFSALTRQYSAITWN